MVEAAAIGLNAASYVLILVLVALGLVVVFGVMRVINMAHGELFMLGAYAVIAADGLGAPFWLGVLAAPILAGAAGAAIEAALIRHIYARPLDTILATWGLSLALKQAIVLAFGPASLSVPSPMDATIAVGTFAYPLYRLIVMGVALVAILGVFIGFFRSGFGLMVRAVVADPRSAACLGIDPALVHRVSFTAGAALAGLAGGLIAPLISVDPEMGVGFLIPAFLAILVGGAGPLAGVLTGGVVVGGADSVLTNWLSPVLAQVVVFALAVVVIRLRRGPVGGLR
ncbi:MAG: branched-chain amino acid ABC transporter permease [Alphaproteobacteria bacterium]|nr:branched-chain amino acid ABC transporter permease [Alphaproteobacteria bacterium]